MKKTVSKTSQDTGQGQGATEKIDPLIIKENYVGTKEKSLNKKKKSLHKNTNGDGNNSIDKKATPELTIKDTAKVMKKKTKKLVAKQTVISSEEPLTNILNSSEKSTQELTPKDLAKIEKKKAKKLAKKLKQKNIAQLNPVKVDANKVDSQKMNEHNETTNNCKHVKPKNEKKKLQKQLTAGGSPNDVSKAPRIKDPNSEAATVFVGNLPINTKRVQLIRLFKNYAPIISIRFRSASGKMIFKSKDRKKTDSLNAYVVLQSPDAAERALALNGVEFKSNHLRVTKASEKWPKKAEVSSKNTIFVGNLKYSATEEKLREIFTSCGEIEYIRCIHNGDNACKGVAYVCFKNSDAITLALELNETILDERPIRVERYSSKKLGAKAARDAVATETTSKLKPQGAQKQSTKRTNNSKPTESEPKKKKKSEYSGVKTDDLKKMKNKKKTSKQLLQLARKIAPKTV